MVLGGVLKGVAATLGVLGLVVVAAGCHTALATPYVIHANSDVVFLVLEQSGASSLRTPADPMDPQVPDTGGNAYAAGSPTTGLTNLLARLQGQTNPAPFRFEATSAKTYYLDIDQSIVGTVFVSNTASAAVGIEAATYRIELRVNGQPAGGMDFNIVPAAASKATTWIPLHFAFAPEASIIRPGDKVALEVTQLAGLADVRIGTGGNHQSFARLQSYPFDPLSGAIYLEKHKLVIRDPNGNLTGANFLAAAEQAGRAGAYDEGEPGLYFLDGQPLPPTQGAGLAAGALFLAPLVWSGARGGLRGRGREVIAVALLVALALSGCASKKPNADSNSDLPPEARPSVDTKVEDIIRDGPNVEPGEVGIGEVAGTVADWRNLTITGAYVALLGTSNFAETDASGRFSFANVTAGKYVVRVDATEMRTIEEKIEVLAGKRTVLTIKMAPLDPTAPDRFAHVHDEWGGKSERVIFETKFTPDTSQAYVTVDSAGAPMCLPWGETSADSRGVDDLCSWPVPFDGDVKVPPGAGAVDVLLSWDGDATEMGIRAYNPGTRAAVNGTYLARGEGVPTRIVFFPHEADPGHQGFTNWLFDVYIPGREPDTIAQKPFIEVGEITVKAIAYRTVVPFEPGHPDLWGDGDAIKLFEEASITYGTVNGKLPNQETSFRPAKGIFVPPGAARIDGRFSMSPGPGGLNAVGQEWHLYAKPANVAAARFQEGLKEVELQGAFPEWTFSIPVAAEDVDQPYQTLSNYYFYPGSSTPDRYYRGEGVTFRMSATVFKG